MVTPLIGLAIFALVFGVALSERVGMRIGFFDWHAAIVVFGGVIGSLCLAVDRRALGRMFMSLRDLLPSASVYSHDMQKNHLGVQEMRKAWREGRRAVVLNMADKAPTMELRTAADALSRQLSGAALEEQFIELRTHYMHTIQPTIEGWEIVARLAPSFGMVGTVTGMVQLFRNLGSDSGNLGGAMAMALLATLYGIAFGAAVGGPMSSRANNQLNERLSMVDLLEKTVASLVEEDSSRGKATVS